MAEDDDNSSSSKPQLSFSSSLTDIHSEVGRRGSGEKTRISNREVVINVGSQSKRGRGRPRLTDEEKQRRKELREMGLIKRSKRRTKEGNHLWVWSWVWSYDVNILPRTLISFDVEDLCLKIIY